MVIVLFRRAIT